MGLGASAESLQVAHAEGLDKDCAQRAKKHLGVKVPLPALFIVVHCSVGDNVHALQQVDIAFTNGADGVFLIIHRDHDPGDLIALYEVVRNAHPHAFIGLNFLCCSADAAMRFVPHDAQALWTDDGVDGKAENHGFDTSVLNAMRIKKERQWTGLLFGAFAFKYSKEMSDSEVSERGPLAASLIDVPTTSGPATGDAMTVEKAQSVRHSMGEEAALAAASGVSSENIASFFPYFTCFLVASSLEEPPKYSGRLIPSRVRVLADLVHSQQRQQP